MSNHSPRPARPAAAGMRPLGGVAVALVAALAIGAASPLAAAGIHEQVFTLQPGWNAVYLEVAPDPEDIESALAGVPVASVWYWNPAKGSVDFIQSPDEGSLKLAGWQGWFPRQRPEHFLSNLFLLQANRAYLVRLDGSQPVTWRVSGTPVLRRREWVTDSFNLTGFQVSPSAPPTFGHYLSSSSAHAGQPVYRLAADGTWQPITAPHSTQVESGTAYWVYCSGASSYQGPLEIDLEYGDRLDFAAAFTSQRLTVRNHADLDVDISLRLLSAAAPVPLSFETYDEVTGETGWPQLPASLSLPAVAGQEMVVSLGVRRAELSVDRADQVLEISNGFGSRILLAVGANTIQPLAGGAKGGRAVSTPHAGLWVGNITVDKVSESQLGGSEPLPTGRPFSLRVLLHVDADGQVRLLKEVIQMWQEGTLTPAAANPEYLEVETPGRVVLVTDQDLIPGLTGVTMRDGQSVGLRLSTVAYDFPGQWVEMSGAVSPTGSVSVNLAMPSDFPTNPFLHRYHPDHDNLDRQFLGFVPEAYAFTRFIELVFSPTPREGTTTPPDWGDSRLGGVYSEKITGLHRHPIFVAGTFVIERMSAVPVLNQ